MQIESHPERQSGFPLGAEAMQAGRAEGGVAGGGHGVLGGDLNEEEEREVKEEGMGEAVAAEAAEGRADGVIVAQAVEGGVGEAEAAEAAVAAPEALEAPEAPAATGTVAEGGAAGVEQVTSGLRGISIAEEGEEDGSAAAAAAALALGSTGTCTGTRAGGGKDEGMPGNLVGSSIFSSSSSSGGGGGGCGSSSGSSILSGSTMADRGSMMPSLVVPIVKGRGRKGKGKQKHRASMVAMQAFQENQKADEASHFGQPANYEQLRALHRQTSTTVNKASNMLGSPHAIQVPKGAGGAGGDGGIERHASGLVNMSASSTKLAAASSGEGGASGDGSGRGLLNMKPIDIARQITVAQHSLFSEITPAELMDSNFTKKKQDANAPNFKKMSAFHEQIGAWCQCQIVLHKDIKIRAEMLGLLIRVADCCVKPLNNYDGAVAITSALKENPIHRLKKTWERALRPKQTTQLAMLSTTNRGKTEEVGVIYDRLMDQMASGARKLKTTMQATNLPCVPFLGAVCDELVSAPELYECRCW
jgi:hypothetical protein